jgi:hypothetical protein
LFEIKLFLFLEMSPPQKLNDLALNKYRKVLTFILLLRHSKIQINNSCVID